MTTYDAASTNAAEEAAGAQERLMRQRIGATYAQGIAAQHANRGARIEVHVAQDVWDYLHSLATASPVERKRWAAPTLFSFAIFLEAAWEQGRIEVWTRMDIA